MWSTLQAAIFRRISPTRLSLPLTYPRLTILFLECFSIEFNLFICQVILSYALDNDEIIIFYRDFNGYLIYYVLFKQMLIPSQLKFIYFMITDFAIIFNICSMIYRWNDKIVPMIPFVYVKVMTA